MKKTILFALALIMQLGAFGQDRMWQQYSKPVSVKGGAGIEQFVTAVLDTKPNEWFNDPVYDRKNGFFSYHEEGAGSVTYNLAYWNRKDGKKLVILSFQETDFGKRVKQEASPWYFYSSVQYGEEADQIINTETGFHAYLYNEAKKQLQPLATPPFNGMPSPLDGHYFLELPRQGKDIIVRHELGEYKRVYHTLTWNGMSFDYSKDELYPEDFFVNTSQVEIYNAPNGKVVFTTDNVHEFTLEILKVENEWALIYDNTIFPNGDDTEEVRLTGSPSGNYWIKASHLAANGRGNAKLREMPKLDANSLMDITEDSFVMPLELSKGWVKVREVKTNKEGWLLREELCSNPLTTCP